MTYTAAIEAFFKRYRIHESLPCSAYTRSEDREQLRSVEVHRELILLLFKWKYYYAYRQSGIH
jgi:hypothetical protein